MKIATRIEKTPRGIIATVEVVDANGKVLYTEEFDNLRVAQLVRRIQNKNPRTQLKTLIVLLHLYKFSNRKPVLKRTILELVEAYLNHVDQLHAVGAKIEEEEEE